MCNLRSPVTLPPPKILGNKCHGPNDIVKNNSDKKKKMLEKKKVNILKKVESFESKLNILETHRWNPMDFKYSSYLTNYCINQLNIIINKLRNERNEYSFKTAYLYDHTHKGK